LLSATNLLPLFEPADNSPSRGIPSLSIQKVRQRCIKIPIVVTAVGWLPLLPHKMTFKPMNDSADWLWVHPVAINNRHRATFFFPHRKAHIFLSESGCARRPSRFQAYPDSQAFEHLFGPEALPYHQLLHLIGIFYVCFRQTEQQSLILLLLIKELPLFRQPIPKPFVRIKPEALFNMTWYKENTTSP
jgi:hypothetical protein